MKIKKCWLPVQPCDLWVTLERPLVDKETTAPAAVTLL